MEFTYKKHDNEKLFASLEKNELGLRDLQNYVPLYNTFFALTDVNWNSINLNNAIYLHDIKNKESENIANGILKDINEGNKTKKPVFFKYSPLLDPLKYLVGKYDITNPTLLNLPSFINPDLCHEKIRDVNNAAYVDSFFSYLTSKLLHDHKFIHGIDFYGSFLSIKEQYPVNIYDDIEYINDFDFFHKNKDVLFTVDEAYNTLIGNDTRNYKKKINVSNNDEKLQLSDVLQLSDITDLEDMQMSFVKVDILETGNIIEPDIIYENVDATMKKEHTEEKKITSRSTSSSSCSSRSSNSSITLSTNDDGTNDDGTNDESDDGSDDGTNEDSYNGSDYSSLDGEDVIVKINEFPVQTIALECCEDTLNSLIEDEDHPLRDEEWDSIVLQILMSLITYQNTFGLTHNDLHTNNIMYTNTEKQFLYYKVDNTYYKVPTFGKLFKIIDFGRAIYMFKDQLMCSDSFHPKGDAATQYNFPPYFNPKKPIVEPNYSFDLCRLGCSIYDCIVDDISEESAVTSPILKIIIDWCKDDKGRNIMYKKNGDERYPDFKLYKMITRKVHRCVPINVLRNPYFEKFKITKKKITKEKLIMNIDEIPCYKNNLYNTN
uniref:Protein kinase domain-containing protein n=1 Tax=viral metagenome TaxID=1070528 RepID=A0A6C0IHS8_9ZZZZ